MALYTAEVPRLAGVCAEAPSGPVPPGLGPLRFSWSHPERGLRVSAYGEALRREAGAGGLAALLGALSRPDGVAWLDGAADARPRPPGPWFGAVGFDPSRRAWSGFAPVRFAAPRLLVWEGGGRRHVAAFAPEGEETRGALQAALDSARRAFDALRAPERDLPARSRAPG